MYKNDHENLHTIKFGNWPGWLVTEATTIPDQNALLAGTWPTKSPLSPTTNRCLGNAQKRENEKENIKMKKGYKIH